MIKKIFSFLTITVLYLVPHAAFAQKAKPTPATKAGRLEIKVSFIAEWSANIDKKNGDRVTTGRFSSKVNADYKYSGTNSATLRNGYVSVDGSKGESTRGQFAYEYNGKLIEKTSTGVATEIDDKGSFAGEITEIGTGSVTMDGQGDDVQEMEVSAFANVRGYFRKTMRSGEKAIVDRGCTNATFAIGVPEISDNQPDASKPAEQACSGIMRHSTNVYKQFTEGDWGPMKVEGSFATGSYTFKYIGSRFPAVFQKNAPGDVHEYKETLSIDGSWTLSGGVVKKPGSAISRYYFEIDPALGTRRFLLGQV